MKSLEHFDLSVNPLGRLVLDKFLFILFSCLLYTFLLFNQISIIDSSRLPDGFTMLLNLTNVYLNDTFLDFLPANIGRYFFLN